MKLYFTRHGKTEWNQQKRFQGMTGDSPLLSTSYDEIKQLGQYLQDIPFEKIYSSPLLRAKNTARGIQQELTHPVEIVYTDTLKELGLGRLEGQYIEEMRNFYGEELDHLWHRLDLYDPTIFDGEPIEQAIQRISETVAEAAKQHEGPVLFVGHGAALTAAIQAMTGKPLSELRTMGGLLNNSLSILETKEASRNMPYDLTLWNDTSFLAKEKSQ